MAQRRANPFQLLRMRQTRKALPRLQQRRALPRQGKQPLRRRVSAAFKGKATALMHGRPGTVSMKMKPAWTRTGWAAVPIFGPLFDIIRNWLFPKEWARAVKRQGRFADRERPPLKPEKAMGPADRLAQARGTSNRFAVKRQLTQGNAVRGKKAERPAA